MADMQITVWLGWKPGVHTAVKPVNPSVIINNIFNKIGGHGVCVCHMSGSLLGTKNSSLSNASMASLNFGYN